LDAKYDGKAIKDLAPPLIMVLQRLERDPRDKDAGSELMYVLTRFKEYMPSSWITALQEALAAHKTAVEKAATKKKVVFSTSESSGSDAGSSSDSASSDPGTKGKGATKTRKQIHREARIRAEAKKDQEVREKRLKAKGQETPKKTPE